MLVNNCILICNVFFQTSLTLLRLSSFNIPIIVKTELKGSLSGTKAFIIITAVRFIHLEPLQLFHSVYQDASLLQQLLFAPSILDVEKVLSAMSGCTLLNH